jgi:hypothetical protein
MSDPLDDVLKLRDAIDRVLAKHNLTRKNFNLTPQDDHSSPPVPSHINLFVRIEPEAIVSEQQREQMKYDSSFSALVAGFDNDPDSVNEMLEQRIREAKELLDEGWADDDEADS